MHMVGNSWLEKIKGGGWGGGGGGGAGGVDVGQCFSGWALGSLRIEQRQANFENVNEN